MKSITSFPFGPILIFITVPYLQWHEYFGPFQIWEAHRAALIFALAVTGFMTLLALLAKSWQIAGVIGLLLAALLLYASGQPVLSITIPGFILLTAIPERRIAYSKAIIFGNVLGIASLGLLYPVWSEVTGERKIISAASAQIGDVTLIQKPSIIHIMLDAYGASDVLVELYGHDNSGFIESLEARGFLVMPKVASPFNQTLFAMASIFSGGYVSIPDKSDNFRAFRSDLGYTATNGDVISAFRKADYQFGYSKSGYAYLELDDAELVTPPLVITGFEAYLARYFPSVHNWHKRQEIKAALNPENLAKLEPPFFYFQHILAPHPPFVFKADGRITSNTNATLATVAPTAEGYREQTAFIESAILEQLTAIPSEIPIVVIVHGDHGPAAYHSRNVLGKACMKERITTFMAIYSNVPEIQKAFAENRETRFNLVNIYRIMFSAISDKTFAPLPSQSRFMRWDSPWKAAPVSDDELSKDCIIGHVP